MPRGYRYVLLVSVGWVIIAASPVRHSYPKQQGNAQRSIARSLQEINTRLNEADQRVDPNKPCAQGRDDHTSDLCAQWKAADAAYDSAVWTRRSFYLSVAGFAVGMLTLIAAGAAAFFAWVAASQARKSNALNMREHARSSRRAIQGAQETQAAMRIAGRNADAATKSASVAERSLIATQRAYIHLDGVSQEAVKDDDGNIVEFIIKMHWINSGRTPALKQRINCNYRLFPHVIPVNFNYLDPPFIDEVLVTVGPGGKFYTYPIRVSLFQAMQIFREELVFCFWSWIEYEDIFENTPRYREQISDIGFIASDPSTLDKLFRFQQFGSFNKSIEMDRV